MFGYILIGILVVIAGFWTLARRADDSEVIEMFTDSVPGLMFGGLGLSLCVAFWPLLLPVFLAAHVLLWIKGDQE